MLLPRNVLQPVHSAVRSPVEAADQSAVWPVMRNDRRTEGVTGNDDVGRSISLARIERRLAAQPLLEESGDAIRGAGVLGVMGRAFELARDTR